LAGVRVVDAVPERGAARQLAGSPVHRIGLGLLAFPGRWHL